MIIQIVNIIGSECQAASITYVKCRKVSLSHITLIKVKFDVQFSDTLNSMHATINPLIYNDGHSPCTMIGPNVNIMGIARVR